MLPHVPPEYASSAGLRNLEAEQALIGAALVARKSYLGCRPVLIVTLSRTLSIASCSVSLKTASPPEKQ